MKKITVREIMKLGPCYTKEQVKNLIGEGKTPLEILDLPISKSDKFWLLLRSDYIPIKQLHILACDFAQEVAYLNSDPSVQAAIDSKRLWVDNKITDEELKKASDAAWAVYVRAAPWAAAKAAADAARAASCDANADWAAWAAARAAAWAAVAAAWAADVETKQIEMVRKVFIDMGITK